MVAKGPPREGRKLSPMSGSAPDSIVLPWMHFSGFFMKGI